MCTLVQCIINQDKHFVLIKLALFFSDDKSSLSLSSSQPLSSMKDSVTVQNSY